jgi:hypothetical protein
MPSLTIFSVTIRAAIPLLVMLAALVPGAPASSKDYTMPKTLPDGWAEE